MSMKKHVGDLLVEAGIITVKTLERALERQKGSGRRLGVVLEEMGVITGEELVNALASQSEIKTIKNISAYAYPQELLDLVPEDFAIHNQIFPLKQKEGMLAIAITDPLDNNSFDFLAKKTGMKIIPVLASSEDVMAAIKKYYLKGEERGSKLKILVVDDSLSIATIIEVALVKEGYEVVIGHDGIEGLKLALIHKPDLIICDAVMPRMDGYAFMRALKANPEAADIPMILLTSKASPEEENTALNSGFMDFIAKPVMPIRVVSRVKRAFEMIQQMKK
jgi:CheY-like chemotaxis protein